MMYHIAELITLSYHLETDTRPDPLDYRKTGVNMS